MKGNLAWLTSCILTSFIMGQVNVEKFRGSSSINFSVSYTEKSSRTTDTNTLLLNALVCQKRGAHEWLAVGGSSVEDQNDVNLKNNQFLHLRYFYQKNTWGPEVFYQFAEDDFSNQRKRNLFGVGLRKLITRKSDSFRGGISVFREHLKLDRSGENGTYQESLELDRGNLYLNYTRPILSVTLYYQPNLESFQEYNLAIESIMSFKLFKDRLFFDIIYNLTQNHTRDIRDSKFMQILRWKI